MLGNAGNWPPPGTKTRPRSVPRASAGAWPCWNLDFWLLASRIVRINYFYFKPMSLWHYLMTAWETNMGPSSILILQKQENWAFDSVTSSSFFSFVPLALLFLPSDPNSSDKEHVQVQFQNIPGEITQFSTAWESPESPWLSFSFLLLMLGTQHKAIHVTSLLIKILASIYWTQNLTVSY